MYNKNSLESSASVSCTEIGSKAEYYGIEHDLRPEDIAQKVKAAEEMLKDIRLRRPFTFQRQLADEESEAAQDCEFFYGFGPTASPL